MAKKRCAHSDKFPYMQKFPCAYTEVSHRIYGDFIPLIIKRKEGAKEAYFPCTLLC